MYLNLKSKEIIDIVLFLLQQELMSINEQLLQEFSSDDVFPLGTPVFMETPNAFSPFDQKEKETFDEVLPNSNI